MPGGPPAGPARLAGDVRVLVDAALAENGLLPDSAVVQDGEVRVSLTGPAGAVHDPVRVAPTVHAAPYQAVSTVRVTSAHTGMVRIAETASPDQVRRAVAASVAELTQLATEHANGKRTDATSMLAEGSRETELSPRDYGRIAECGSCPVTSTGRCRAATRPGSAGCTLRRRNSS